VTDEHAPVSLTTAGGLTVAGDRAVPAAPRAAAVLCHPHPAYGGDRHNAVVDALFRALPGAGVAALRFDFGRGDEGAQVVAALDDLATAAPGVPLWLVGYSYGGDVALGVDDPRAAGWVAVAPPLRFGGTPVPAGGDPRPVLLVVPEHDQYSAPETTAAAAATWPDATVEVVPGADHFLAGAAGRVAATVTAWLATR
jgi:uncharacterized protein